MSGHAEKYAIKYAKHVAAAYLAAPLMFITNMLNKQITTAPSPSPSSHPPCTWIALEVIVYEAPPHTHTRSALVRQSGNAASCRRLICCAPHTSDTHSSSWMGRDKHLSTSASSGRGQRRGADGGICSIFAWRFLRIFFLSLLENIFVP